MHVQVTQPCVMENRDAGQVLGSQLPHNIGVDCNFSMGN